jgi:hypothetical protein
MITEPVNEKIGGHTVYRTRRSDSPPGLGDYIGCDPQYGEVWVATDSWDVNDPSNYTREVFDKPIPIDLCPYGTTVGTVCDNSEFVGHDFRTVVEVLAYEDVTVPYKKFQNTQKVKITYYDDGEVDDDMPPIFQWNDASIGIVKELEVEPGSEIGIELIAYQPPTGGSGMIAPSCMRPTKSILHFIRCQLSRGSMKGVNKTN